MEIPAFVESDQINEAAPLTRPRGWKLSDQITNELKLRDASWLRKTVLEQVLEVFDIFAAQSASGGFFDCCRYLIELRAGDRSVHVDRLGTRFGAVG